LIPKNKPCNRPDVFGEQVAVNEFDEVVHFNDRLLIGATQLKLDEVVHHVHRLGGLSIASHVDRPSYSILSQLGFIPQDLELDALEVSYRSSPESYMGCVPGGEKLSVITSSDAHFNSDIGKVYTSFLIEIPNVEEIRMAFQEQSGRRVIY
jgi:PHP family Zn ribbon phosphoesterase